MVSSYSCYAESNAALIQHRQRTKIFPFILNDWFGSRNTGKRERGGMKS
jgi:hypothetical protein